MSGLGDVRRTLLGLPDAEFPLLRRAGADLPDLTGEATVVLDGLEPDGSIADRASEGLREVRAAKARVGSRLHARLEAYLRDPGAGSVIRDDFITQRNNRYVIPVRVDAPRPVRGIVHATSSSGATLFVEPLPTVELNNELVRLADREREEEERILLRWAEAFHLRLDEVGAAVETLARLDGLEARVRFGRATGGITPRVATGNRLVYRAVRHPLLDRRLREQGAECVPLNLSLDPAEQVLVLSGPNTGGKTVALKTFGLTVLMAQAGIPVPAREIELPLYRQLRADIGDRQSIHADLSTYSAHVRSVVEFLASARPPALFLFDEIGTGTDPGEGAALARSILEALRRPGMTTMATTHQGALKSWAFASDGAASAAMEFDAASLRPTFRILMGAAGTSAGLEIAERLGLPEEIVERARVHLGEGGMRAEAYMNRLRELTAELEERGAELERREREASERRRSLEARAAEREERRRVDVTRALDRALQELRRTARRGLAAIEERRERRRAEHELAGLEGKLAREAARHAEEISGAAEPAGWRPAAELAEGMVVRVSSLGREGEVQRVRGEEVEVKLGRVVFRVDRRDLRVRARGANATSPPKPRASDAVESRPSSDRELPEELMLIGKRVDESLEEVDRFLDAAVLAGRREVRIVHGHGTGRLRRAVREHLRSHAQARGHRPGKPHEGGDGATIVRLA
jgi:DNA mismatch repair protein MutS2